VARSNTVVKILATLYAAGIDFKECNSRSAQRMWSFVRQRRSRLDR
jgi:hypothetical protein